VAVVVRCDSSRRRNLSRDNAADDSNPDPEEDGEAEGGRAEDSSSSFVVVVSSVMVLYFILDTGMPYGSIGRISSSVGQFLTKRNSNAKWREEDLCREFYDSLHHDHVFLVLVDQ